MKRACSRSAPTTTEPEWRDDSDREHSLLCQRRFLCGIILQQLWPVQVEGRASTLVWRGDMISSAAVGSLRGIERIAAESTMIKDVPVIALFRREAGAR